MKSTHTPTPWKLGAFGEKERPFVASPYGYAVADTVTALVSEDEAKDNAAFIVKAVNCHEALVEACKEQHKAIDFLFALLIRKDKNFIPSKSGLPWVALQKGNQAIEKAEAE